MFLTKEELSAYYNKLCIVNNVKFTPREIDIIACIINGRGSYKEIASLFSITSKSVDTNKSNINRKLQQVTHLRIRDFIEKSSKYNLIKQHYEYLIYEYSFIQTLKKISKLVSKNIVNTFVINLIKDKATTIDNVEKYLAIANIHLDADSKSNKNITLAVLTPTTIDTELKKHVNENIIYILIDHKSSDNLTITLEKVNYVLLEPSYYFVILDLIKKIIPHIDIEDIISEFKTISQKQINLPEKIDSQKPQEEIIKKINDRKHILLISAIFILMIGVIYIWFANRPKDSLIKSDLLIPIETALLERPRIIEKIHTRLNSDEKSIKSIALTGIVGMGGVGKTTIARYYGKNIADASIVWELNAESKESTVNSIRELSYRLASTPELIKELEYILQIQAPDQQEQMLLNFAKSQLKLRHGWLLIYDNVDSFSAIQHFFPNDYSEWGSGKIIITTRNASIMSTSYIKPENAIHIDELDEEESLILFSKILYDIEPKKLDIVKLRNAKNFLKNIPPFPLDISVAAYYLKQTNSSFEEYSVHLNEDSANFDKIQKSVLEEVGEYSETRYNIVKQSINHIIGTNQDIVDLLSCIGFLDSQNIPKILLDKYKSNIIVDNFIRELQKYSLITIREKSILGPLISIHRSTQSAIIKYLQTERKIYKNKYSLSNIANILNNYVYDALELENIDTIKILLPHYKSLMQYQPLDEKQLNIITATGLGGIYFYLGDYTKSKHILEEATLNINYKDKNNIPILLDLFVQLLCVYAETDEMEKMHNIHEKVQGSYKEYLMLDTKNAARSLSHLGDVDGDIGRYREAEQYLLRSEEIFQKLSSRNSIGFAKNAAFLGNIYRKLGDYKKANSYLSESLQYYKKHWGNNHFRTGWILIHLGNIEVASGNHIKAIELFNEGIEIFKRYCNDTDIAWATTQAAEAYRLAGEYNKAKKILTQNIEVYRKNYTEYHGGLGRTYFYLGKLYKEIKDYSKAELYFEKALLAWKYIYGENHLEVARIYASIGDNYLLEGKIEKAENNINLAYQIFKREQHPDIHIVLELLSMLSLNKKE